MFVSHSLNLEHCVDVISRIGQVVRQLQAKRKVPQTQGSAFHFLLSLKITAHPISVWPRIPKQRDWKTLRELLADCSQIFFGCSPAFPTHTQGGLHIRTFETTQDEHLLIQIAQRSETAFEAFYDRHSTVVYSLARKILRTQTDSEEVMQDVFVRVWNKAADFDPSRGTVMAWLMTIAHHTAVDVYRRNQNRQTDELDDAAINTASQMHAHDLDATDLVLDRMVAAKALDMLETSDRLVLEALYFEGLSQSQLAARTGLPLGTLKSRARSALQRLRAHFEEAV
jgi:RNA polymerase sigma-70 factor, ECF subfamily